MEKYVTALTECQFKHMPESEYEEQKKVYVLYYVHKSSEQIYADEKIEFDSFDEAKQFFDEHMTEYEKVKQTVKETCEPHSLCEDEQSYDEESLSIFIEALIEKDSELYKRGNDMLYQITILPLTKKEIREANTLTK